MNLEELMKQAEAILNEYGSINIPLLQRKLKISHYMANKVFQKLRGKNAT